ncbi:C2 domain-containing protein 3-like [Schistocerca americana]|uniref:C2 domain-containing protein 3-like n=1 Tax=Schistocerca americana TaxID=7009 RepID=UPI001F4F7764|nr:C2 domain-containing protein 3-like [Schistocerca americana]
MNVAFPVKNSTYGSLPPLVEGEVFSYLTLKVDHILWRKKPPGDIAVLARWWGDSTVPVFKPSDVRNRGGHQTSQSFIYEIKAPINLFETYLEDSDHLELFVVQRGLNELIGTAKISNLKKIIYENPYQVYVPILNSLSKVGDLHVCFVLHNDDPLSRNFSHKQAQCPGDETRKQIKFQTVNANSNSSLAGRKHILRSDDRNENHNKDTHCQQYHSSTNLTARCKSDGAPQSARNCTNDALLLKVLTQSVKLRNAMVKSILEDNDLLVRNSALTNNETTVKERSALRSGENVAVSVDPSGGVMEYLLGKKIGSESKDSHEALRSLAAPMPDRLKLMENTDKMDDSFVKIKRVREKEVIPFDGISRSEQQDSQSSVPSENNKCDTTANNTQLQHDRQSLNDIRWLRVDVCRFILQQDTVLKVLGTKFLPRSSFFAEFELPVNLVCPCKGKQQKPWNNRVHRFCSRKQLNNVVEFDKSISCRIQTNGGDTLERIKLSNLTFTMYSRHMKQKSPVLIGTGELSLTQLLKPDASNKHEIPVFSKLQSVDGPLFLGTLIVVVELISNKDMLNNSGVRNGNGKQDNQHQVLSSSSEESGLKLSAQKAERCNSQNEAVPKENAVPTKLATKIRCADTEQDSLREKILLHILLHIPEGCGFRYETTYLVTRMLWHENVSRSSVQSGTESPKYDFHEVLPVYLDNNFLQRCHNNIMVTEVWCDNKLLGLVKMSLEPFYTAFCNQTVRAKWLTQKSPVVGLDGWVDIVNPASGLKVGQLLVVLAAGTKTQIKTFEYSLMPEVYGLSNDKKLNCEQLYDYDEDCNNRIVNHSNPIHKKSHLCSSNDSSTKQKPGHRQHVVSGGSIIDTVFPPKFVNGESTKITSPYERQGNYRISHGDPHTNKETAKPKDKISVNNSNDVLMNSAFESSETNIESADSNMGISTSDDDINRNLHGHVTNREKISIIGHPNSSGKTCTQKYHYSDSVTKSKSGSSNRHCTDDMLNPGFLSSDRDTSLSQTYHVLDKRGSEMEYMCLNTASSELDEQASSVDNAIIENKRRRRADHQISSTDTVSTEVSVGFSGTVVDTVHQQEERKSETCFHAHIEVINALHLPLVRRSKKRVQPSCYVTFEVSTPTCDDDKKLLTTPVAWHTTSPAWDWSCDTWLPVRLLKDKSKSLIFKIWIKAETSGKEEDNILGHVSVDLTVLLFGMPWISGWFNITDFTGNNKGQIKINITPLESLTRFSIQQLSEDYQKLPLLQQAASLFDTAGIKHNKSKMETNSISSVDHSLEGIHCPTASGSAIPALDDFGDISSFLSSALKNKLLELDEITQRLKHRLNSVTQEVEEEDLSVDPEFDMDDIAGDECSSWNAEDQTVVPGNVLESQKHRETQTSGVTGEGNKFIEKPQHFNNENGMVAYEKETLHIQKDNLTLENGQRNKLDGDYSKTVDKLATLTIDKTGQDEICRNDFDSLSSYFKDIASKDLELENVFNPLLFQQLLNCSNPQPLVQQGTHRSRQNLCSSQVGDEFISNVNENIYKNLHMSDEQKATDNIRRNTHNSERMNFSPSLESCLENTHNTEHDVRENSVMCNAGSDLITCATRKSVSCETLLSSSENLTEVKAVSESEFITNNFSSSFPSEFFSVMNTQEIEDGRVLGEDSVTKPCNSLNVLHTMRNKGSFLEESNSSVLQIQRLAPEGGNPSENSSHSQQTNTSDNRI